MESSTENFQVKQIELQVRRDCWKERKINTSKDSGRAN